VQVGEPWAPATPDREVVVHVHWELVTQWHSSRVFRATTVVQVFPVTPCRATDVELEVCKEYALELNSRTV